MRRTIASLLALCAGLTAHSANAQLLMIDGINMQPMVPYTYSMAPYSYSAYGYSMDVGPRIYSLDSPVLIGDSAWVPGMGVRARSQVEARNATLIALIPLLLELFPDLQIPGLDLNNSSQIDRLEQKVDKLLAAHNISDDDTGGGAPGSSLEQLLRLLLGLFSESRQGGVGVDAPALRAMSAETKDRIRRVLMTEMERQLEADEEPPQPGDLGVASDQLEEAIHRLEDAQRAAKEALIRANTARRIDMVLREEQEQLRNLHGDAGDESERVEALMKRLEQVLGNDDSGDGDGVPTGDDDDSDPDGDDGDIRIRRR